MICFVVNWCWFACMLGTQTTISLLFIQPSDEGAIGNLIRGWLLDATTWSHSRAPPPLVENDRRGSEFEFKLIYTKSNKQE